MSDIAERLEIPNKNSQLRAQRDEVQALPTQLDIQIEMNRKEGNMRA